MSAAPTASERGLLRPSRAGERYELRRYPPAPDLADLIERHWVSAWDLRGRPPYEVELLPHPAVNLIFGAGPASFAGPGTSIFRFPLRDRGSIFGVKLRPGTGEPYVRAPMVTLVDRSIALEQVLGGDVARLDRAVCATENDEARVALVEAHLRAHRPDVDAAVADQIRLVGDIVRALLTGDRTARVESVAAEFGLTARTLQRLFRRYVGVAPKQVLLRYRLHEAADRISTGDVTDWAGFAADMGYADQSHFVRDFTATVERTPTEYARQCAADRLASLDPALAG